MKDKKSKGIKTKRLDYNRNFQSINISKKGVPLYLQHNRIEEDIFKVIIPIKKRSEGLNEGLNEGLRAVFEYFKNNPGSKAKDAQENLRRPIKTIERQVKELIERGLIERRGSRKTGGYYKKQK